MKPVDPHVFTTKIRPVLLAELPSSTFHELFPVAMEDLDPLVEAEPSIGATVRLKSGVPLVVTYGTITGRLTLEASARRSIASVLAGLYREVPRLQPLTTWEAAEPLRSAPSAKRSPSPLTKSQENATTRGVAARH